MKFLNEVYFKVWKSTFLSRTHFFTKPIELYMNLSKNLHRGYDISKIEFHSKENVLQNIYELHNILQPAVLIISNLVEIF